MVKTQSLGYHQIYNRDDILASDIKNKQINKKPDILTIRPFNASATLSRHFVHSPHVGSHRMLESLDGCGAEPRNHACPWVQ